MRFLIACMAIAFSALPVCGKELIIRSPVELNAACSENRGNLPFEITGTVVIPPAVPQGLFTLLANGELISLVAVQAGRTEGTSFDTRIGDRVIARGRTEEYLPDHITTANCYALQILSAGSLPETPPMNLRDFLSGNISGARITALHGRLQDVFPDDIDTHFIFAVLKDGSDSINLVCNGPRSWLADFRSLLGCDVIVTGIGMKQECDNHRHLAPQLKIAGTNAFRIISHPCNYPFNVPEFISDNATDPGNLATLGPRILRGVVLAAWGRESFLLRTTHGDAVRVDLADGPLPGLHASVEAVGIVESDLRDFALARASWRPIDLSTAADDVAEEISLDRLFTTGRTHYPSINVNAHGTTLTVRGTVKSISHGEDGSRRLILADGNYSIPVICGPNARGLPPPEEGWRIAVTGVCIKDSDVWRPTVPIPKIRGIFLVTRSDADLVVLRKTPWWTPARLAVAIAILVIALIAIFIWNVTLRILIDRRSREVIRAQTARIESELRIGERTRLAAELHDNIVQNLTAIAYRITAAQGALGCREPETRQILQVAAKMLKSCRTGLRRCLWDLRNDALDERDFAAAIRRTAETVAGDAKLTIRFSGRRDLINDTTAHAILSILRELVSNSTVHGGADSVNIAGEARPGCIRFSVKDNGVGFDPAHRPGQDDGHFGLDGIQERLEGLGGTIDIDSSPGKGTYIRIGIHPGNISQNGERT